MSTLQRDPVPYDWGHVSLPDTWPDTLNLKNPLNALRMLLRVIGPRSTVKLPPNLIGCDALPAYLLHEFHRIPNGNFSNVLSAGYAKSFDWSMLGLTHRVRREAAKKITGATSALDIGCGNGALAGAFKRSGIADVWGLDASPYLLKQADEAFLTNSLIEIIPLTRVERGCIGNGHPGPITKTLMSTYQRHLNFEKSLEKS